MYANIQKEIKRSLDILNNGGIILYPSDTIWGIGCDATNVSAVKRIYTLKKRSDSKSMLVLLDSISKLSHYVKNVPKDAFRLIELSNNKPLTIIYDNAKNLAINLIDINRTIGIRITKELFSKSLCFKLKKPLVSTSANISGQPTPAFFSEINNEIIQSVDYVVNYRRNETHLINPSKIIQIQKTGIIKVLRQ